MLCILWNVKSVVYSMWIALARHRLRFNNYKACNRKFIRGSLGIPLADFFGILQGRIIMGFIKVMIIDRINWNCRTHESFWKYKLETFAPLGFNIRLVDT